MDPAIIKQFNWGHQSTIAVSVSVLARDKRRFLVEVWHFGSQVRKHDTQTWQDAIYYMQHVLARLWAEDNQRNLPESELHKISAQVAGLYRDGADDQWVVMFEGLNRRPHARANRRDLPYSNTPHQFFPKEMPGADH